MSKVCVDVTRLPPLLSPLSHHTSRRRCWLAPVMHLIWHTLSVGERLSQCVGVGLRVKAHFHYGCALRCVAWREIQRRGQCFYSYHDATLCNTMHSQRNGNKPLNKHSAHQ